MLSCKEFVAQQSERLDGREFGIGERISMTMHYFFCHHCRRYMKQLTLVDAVSRQIEDVKPDPAAVETSLEVINDDQQEKEN